MKKKLPLEELKANYKKREKSILKDYFTFLKFKSISSEPMYKEETKLCAEWLKNYIDPIGFDTEMWETAGNPVLFASNLEAGPDKPTILIYNHYDVQPVDPIEEWDSPPFEPEIRDGQVYARGAQDNKGQCFYMLQGLRALREINGRFPINIKLCIEGEEECGSLNLSDVLRRKKKQLKADYLAIVDVGIPGPNLPAITLGTRGIVTMDVEVRGSATDLHSGSHGGLAYNPNHALVEILAKLRTPEGRIAVPGFYDRVLKISRKEKDGLNFDFNAKNYAKQFGCLPTGGEASYEPLERNWLRPTLEINGISGGYSGEGFKTVIPAKASAKISCRLVPDQDPKKIGEAVAKHIKSLAPEGTSVNVHMHPGGGKPIRADASSPVVQAFGKAYEEIFQRPCQYIFEGASIPIVTELAIASGSDVVLVGLGLADDRIHAPNEHFGIDRLEKGALIIALALEALA